MTFVLYDGRYFTLLGVTGSSAGLLRNHWATSESGLPKRNETMDVTWVLHSGHASHSPLTVHSLLHNRVMGNQTVPPSPLSTARLSWLLRA